MSGKETEGQNETRPTGFLQVIVSRNSGILAVIAVVATVVTQVENILSGVSDAAKAVSSIFRHPAPPAVAAVTALDCFKADIHVEPVAFAIQKWNKVKFQLTARNDCPQKLDVHFAYKTQSESIRIEPPFKDPDKPPCAGYEIPDCWESRSIDGGQALNWDLIRPRLTHLGELTEPAEVAINWVVFHTTTRTPMRSGSAGLTVKGNE